MFVTPILAMMAMAQPPQDLLPDLTIWTDKLLDNQIDTTTISGHTLLRLSTGTPNIGAGRLELRGGAVLPNGQQVNQRIYRDDATFWERPAGTFTYHQGHAHIHFDGWCRYRLRAKLPNGDPGAILAVGQKTSFCILDLVTYDSSLPGYRNPGYYSGCGSTVQGLTPGMADIYSKGLTDQWVDITGIPDGDYFLEAEVDPDGLILEADETNNIGRIPIHVGAPPPTQADVYEENDTKAEVDARSEGTNSPNLGLINAKRVMENLSMQASDPDWFKFRINHTGGSGDYVKIEGLYPGGDIDLRLYNSAGTEIASSLSATNTETISLSGRPAGTYYIQAFPYSGNNPQYRLTVQPSGNLPPLFTLNEPSQMIYVERSYETFRMSWIATDPENDPMRIGFSMNRSGVLTKGTLPVLGYEAIPAQDLAVNINTAEMAPGRWYFFAGCTDGGITVTKRTPQVVMIYLRGDLDFNNTLNQKDVAMAEEAVHEGRIQRWMVIVGDMDRDGDFDHDDAHEIEEHASNP